MKREIRWDRIICIAILLGLTIMTIIGISTVQEKQETTCIRFLELKKKEVMPIEDFIEMINKMEEEKNSTNLVYLGEFLLTGYCDCEICNGIWTGYPCYNGEMAEEGYTIAVDPNVIPINSFVWVDGVRYKAQDTGSAIIGNHIDVFVGSHEGCYADFCNGYHEVYLEV